MSTWACDRWPEAWTLAIELEFAEFHLSLSPTGELVVSPRSRLVAGQRQAIRRHLPQLRLVLLAADPGVVTRQETFRRFLLTAPASVVVPMLTMGDTEPFEAGRCLSCRERVRRTGLCWRCVLAQKLELGLPIPDDFEALMGARTAA